MKFKWNQAPTKTQWGHDMVETSLEIDKDHTLSLYCERDQTEQVEAMLNKGAGMSAETKQVGGDHYKKLKIQPMRYSMLNNMNACQHTAIKYITRYKDKGDPIENLEKAIHTIELLIQFEKELTG